MSQDASTPPLPSATAPLATAAPAITASTALLAAGSLWCLAGIFRIPQVGGAIQQVLEAMWPSPAKALGVGIVLALIGIVTTGKASKTSAKYLMQSSIVLAGAAMNATEVLRAGAAGILFTIATIAGSFGLGWLLWKWLKTDGKVTTLLSSGTAICGGSAIAAVSPVINASSAQISVAMATVFILNGVALYAFPPLGEWLGLTAHQFGTWAGIAIHDTSSVYGAGQAFDRAHPGADALQQALAVKLSRALWIAPIVFVAAWQVKRAAQLEGQVRVRTPFPWFILWFLAACAACSMFPVMGEYKDVIRRIAGVGMTLALLLIGAGLSREALRTVGAKPMVQGVIQWLALGLVSLAAIRWWGA